jgi:lysophospholipase
MALEMGMVRSADDTLDLRYGVLRPGAERFVVFLNGRTEWIEKYAYLPDDLSLPVDCGFLTFDHRGQGGSGGVRTHVSSYEVFARDAAAVIEKVVGSRPYAIVSHSMGALVALYGTLRGILAPRSLVLSSPLLGMPDKPIPRTVAGPLAKTLSLLRLGTVSTGGRGSLAAPFAENLYTHHAERYDVISKSPYGSTSPTFGWVAATFAATAACFDPRLLAGLTAPTLVLGGTKEGIVEFEAFHRWVQLASSAAKVEVQLKLVQGAKHELYSEIPEFYGQALAATRAWLAANTRKSK